MRGLLLFSVSLLCSAGMLSQNVPATRPDSIRVDVPLVSLDVTVVDSQGKAVTSLNRYDFEILEDGKAQAIRNFSPVNTPYSVLMLFDCSDSTRDRLNLLLDAMGQFIDRLRTSDHTELAAFGDQIHVILDWKSDRKHKINFGDNPICKSTDFYGALNWSVKELHEVSGRRGVVVFSDGFQSDIARQEVTLNGNKVRRVVPPQQDPEFQKVLSRVHSSGVPFYFVAVDTDLNPGREYSGPVPDLQQVRARMEQLARESGGQIVYPKDAKEVVPLFLDIGRELGSSYSLAYTPPRLKDGQYHSIEVQVHGDNYRVEQSRKGYTSN
jgi:hypothetical protein